MKSQVFWQSFSLINVINISILYPLSHNLSLWKLLSSFSSWIPFYILTMLLIPYAMLISDDFLKNVVIYCGIIFFIKVILCFFSNKSYGHGMTNVYFDAFFENSIFHEWRDCFLHFYNPRIFWQIVNFL